MFDIMLRYHHVCQQVNDKPPVGGDSSLVARRSLLVTRGSSIVNLEDPDPSGIPTPRESILEQNGKPLGELPTMSIEIPTLAHFRHFSSLFTNLPSTSVENPRQIDPFMQNKANQSQFQRQKMDSVPTNTRRIWNDCCYHVQLFCCLW
jgi:hypothetical protein